MLASVTSLLDGQSRCPWIPMMQKDLYGASNLDSKTVGDFRIILWLRMGERVYNKQVRT